MKKLMLAVLVCYLAGALSAQEWNTNLDSARLIEYMSNIEKDVVFEMNKARSDPKRYAEEYIKPRLLNFSGKYYAESGSARLLTVEGVTAVQVCISAMSKQQSAPPLLPERGMYLGAADHVRDQADGAVGHYGSDRSDPSKRISRYGQWQTTWGENISYGRSTGREIVIGLLIDDGVPNRGHYENIMNGAFGVVGVAVGSHKNYGQVCVIDFAGTYTTSPQYQDPSVIAQAGRPQSRGSQSTTETWIASLVNQSGYAWAELYVAEKGALVWGENVLTSAVRSGGGRTDFALPSAATAYDLKIVTDAGRIFYVYSLEKAKHQQQPALFSGEMRYVFFLQRINLTDKDTSGRR